MPTFTSSSAWQALLAHRDALSGKRLAQMWADDPGRGAALTFDCAGIAVDFSKQRIDAATIGLLVALARSRDLPAAVEKLFTGAHVNASEDRPALHPALRGDEHVMVAGEDILPSIQRNRERMRSFAEAVRDGLWKGVTGERFTHVLALGIGGSSLGPRLAIEALRAEANGPEVRFVANIAAAEFDDAVSGLDPRRTLVVIASKTFTTQETMVNAIAAREWLTAALGEEALARHVIAATANVEASTAWGLPACNIFPFAEGVGGRYSLWSASSWLIARG